MSSYEILVDKTEQCTIICYADVVISGEGIFWDSPFKQRVIQMVKKFGFSVENFIDTQLPWQLYLALEKGKKLALFWLK